jgi:hypothetical protein
VVTNALQNLKKHQQGCPKCFYISAQLYHPRGTLM